MAKQKRNSKGYIVSTFTWQGKQYKVYGKNITELAEKTAKKQKELQEQREIRTNPSISTYYEYFTELRLKEQKGATIRAQRYQFKNIAETKLSNGEFFGDLKIREITRRDIEEARQILLESGKTPENLNICFAHLNHVFETALIDDTIVKNPCKALKRLKRETAPISENKHRALEENELVAFLKASEERNSFYHNAFLLMALTGLRVGELGALFLRDIDNNIHVRRTITRNEHGCYGIGEDTKTYSGKRDIPVNAEIRRIIKEQRELNSMIFHSENISKPLFLSSEGELLREYTINREIARICKTAGIEKFTCHCFRVTFATRFIEQRPQDFKILSEIMGHKDIAITLNLYTRVMAENKAKAMNDLIIKIS